MLYFGFIVKVTNFINEKLKQSGCKVHSEESRLSVFYKETIEKENEYMANPVFAEHK